MKTENFKSSVVFYGGGGGGSSSPDAISVGFGQQLESLKKQNAAMKEALKIAQHTLSQDGYTTCDDVMLKIDAALEGAA